MIDLNTSLSGDNKDYGQFYDYIGNSKMRVKLVNKTQDQPKYKHCGRIVTEAEMKDRIELKKFRYSQIEEEKQKYKGIALQKGRLMEIDKNIRRTLKEAGYDANSSNFLDSEYSKQQTKEKKSPGESKSIVNAERGLTYEEWINKKNTESIYWKMMIEAERQEQLRIKEEKEKELQDSAKKR